MDGKSLNLTEEKLNKLKEIIPEAFTENKIDWEKLKAALGKDVEFKNERYVLNWAGKSDSFRVLQTPTTATLTPEKDESVNFDKTENIFIEGENLEVLKVLQKSYFGKIKMIYIDPPYNTGNDNFIYPDKFSETREEYLSRIGDKDENGYITNEGLFRKNSKDSGHYHSNWLSMMYPRLFLARNLLKDDGVIFVSIDDNEVHNLRLLMNEVFGEENFGAAFIIKSNPRGSQSNSYSASVHEYLLCFVKNYQTLSSMSIGLSEDMISEYKLHDSKGKYRLLGLRQRGGSWRREDRPLLFFPIFVNEDNGEISLENKFNNSAILYPIKPSSKKDGTWRWSKSKILQSREYLVAKKISRDDKIIWDIFQKDYLNNEEDLQKETKAKTIWDEKFFNYQFGTNELKSLFNEKNIFDFPKPIALQKRILELSGSKDSIILDFFTGSGSTAHAVLDLNKEDGGNRKFICVQLPEKCDEKSEAYKAGYETIAEIGKERIRRVIKKIKNEKLEIKKKNEENLFNEDTKHNQDLGFKVFKLQESNFKIWRTNIENEEQLIKQLEDHLEPLDETAKTENVLYELLLKSGISLTAKIEQKDGYYLVNENEIALILEKVDNGIIKNVIKAKPKKVITLDRLFKNNDQLKTNTALQMKDSEIEFKVV